MMARPCRPLENYGVQVFSIGFLIDHLTKPC
jgi:hypothetical protein